MKSTTTQNVVVLGWVSLFNDLASEVLARLVPFYLSGVLGAPMSVVGLVEGAADALSTLLKPVFGRISDRTGLRKRWVVLGYAASALARPLLAFAGSWGVVAAFRALDKFGKGVRTGPRDALIADSSAKDKMGRGFGLNRALDTLGAMLSVGIYWYWNEHHGGGELTSGKWRALALACSLPGLCAVALVLVGVREVKKAAATQKLNPAYKLPPLFWRYLAVVGLFSLANSSDAFILLRAKELGFTFSQILGLMVFFNFVSALTTLPAAILSDRWGRKTLIVSGWVIYAIAYAIFGSHPGAVAFVFTMAVYGLFYGFTDGVERAWIADLAPSADRGRAYGWFGLVTGMLALPASLIFGMVWDGWGSSAPFLLSAGIALAAAGLLTLAVRKT